MSSLSDWFIVECDDEKILVKIIEPGTPSKTEILWKEIIRVCYKTGCFLESDEIFIFVKHRLESYLIPTEAFGAIDLWGEIIERGLFEAKHAVRAVMAEDNTVTCWPSLNQ
ncbi:MAG: hypothetical protein BAJATHORv1_90042 [Candidatus Thorarchaeota archaeon]|nr:MAG: hypothetical protein BAJATHORv1_90042 [Candidatus Thorarchaeota archaeon]